MFLQVNDGKHIFCCSVWCFHAMFFPWPGHGPQPSKDVAKPGDTTEFINALAGSETPRMGLNSSYRLGGGDSQWEIIGRNHWNRSKNHG